MTDSSAAFIGTSLVEALGVLPHHASDSPDAQRSASHGSIPSAANGTNAQAADLADRRSRHARAPCMLFPKGVHSVKQPSRVLLRGPKSAGKTSIAMDLAYAVASNAPCRCGRSKHVCECIAVVFFCPLPVSHNQQQQQSQQFQDYEHGHSPTTAAQSAKFPMRCFQIQDDDPMQPQSRQNTWSANILRRIEIRHVSSFKDIAKYLLTVQSLPSNAQPSHGFVIDDLDKFVWQNTMDDSLAQTRALQLFALMVNAANSLSVVHHTCPFVLATTQHSISAPLMNMFVTISTSKWPLRLSRRLHNEDTIQAHWKLVVTEMMEDMQVEHKNVTYCQTSRDRTTCVRWMEG